MIDTLREAGMIIPASLFLFAEVKSSEQQYTCFFDIIEKEEKNGL